MAAKRTVADLLPLPPGVARPNAYQVVGLEPGESDATRIRQRIAEVTAHLKSVQGEADPQAWKSAATAVTRARKILLDPEAKRAYDARFRPAPEPVAAGPATTPPLADPLADLLPGGDPSRPFDMAEYLDANPDLDGPGDEEEETAEDAAFAGEDAPLSFDPFASDAAPADDDAPGRSSDRPAPFSVAPAAAPVAVRPATRRRRSRLPITGILMSLVVVGLFTAVGFCLWLLLNNEGDTVADAGGGAEREAPAEPEPEPPAEPDPVMGDLAPARPARDSRPSRFALPGLEDEDIAPRDEPSEAEEPGGMDEPSGAEEPSEPAMEPEPAPAADSASEAEAEERLAAARDAIRNGRWEAMVPQAEEALRAAATDDQRAEADALRRLAAFADDYRTAVVDAATGMGAGESFELRPGTPVVLVESSPEQLVIRAAGQNKSYAMDELPLIVAHALAPMRLPADAPTTLASKAAYQAISPLATADHRQQAFGWWEEAAESGEVDTTGLRAAVERLFP